ncbi:hypothetical protein MAR_018516 [Mya arenaria]|uniref:Uncharacterized protein n=1 Tax=Mya arenaria TaxID=6604 RepID=A0ABY7EIS9_MYAAR|nr:hypothetical protein MAR_018516 [Mya arenaria]
MFKLKYVCFIFATFGLIAARHMEAGQNATNPHVHLQRPTEQDGIPPTFLEQGKIPITIGCGVLIAVIIGLFVRYIYGKVRTFNHPRVAKPFLQWMPSLKTGRFIDNKKPKGKN